MWIATFVVGWVIGSVSLYAYLVATAREPVRGECVECRQTECASCPHVAGADQEVRRAA